MEVHRKRGIGIGSKFHWLTPFFSKTIWRRTRRGQRAIPPSFSKLALSQWPETSCATSNRCSVSITVCETIKSSINIGGNSKKEKPPHNRRGVTFPRSWMQGAEWRNFHCSTSGASGNIFLGNHRQKFICLSLATRSWLTSSNVTGHRWCMTPAV